MRVLLVDDQNLILQAMRILLESLGFEVVEAGSGADAIALAGASRFGLVLLDVAMPDLDGIDTLRQLRRNSPELPVVMLSSYDQIRDVRDALAAGARGYVIKSASPDQLRQAIETALEPEGVYVHPLVQSRLQASARTDARVALSERESDFLEHVIRGETNEQIARALSVSAKTVKSHLSSIFRKLDVTNRTEAVAKAIRQGFALGTEGRSDRVGS